MAERRMCDVCGVRPAVTTMKRIAPGEPPRTEYLCEVHAARGLRRVLMGSVSDSVVRHAHCPVLIVRAEKRERRHLEGSGSHARWPRREGSEKKRSFWDTLFGPYPSWREEKVIEYVIHRLGDGTHLRDVMQEEYVRRLASPDEVEDILDNPRLVAAARRKMEEDLSSGKPDQDKTTTRGFGTGMG